MIPTPNLSHLTSADYDSVYEPAEDTYLLLDALEQDAEHLRELHATVCLEVGSGSGCVSSFLGSILGSTALYLCTDINPHACICSFRTGLQNKTFLDVVNTTFAGPFHHRLKNAIDVILFNPPYVPTDREEALNAQSKRYVEGSWAGGKDGMDITDRFLDVVKELLSPRGLFYLVALKQNDIPNIQRRMQDKFGLSSQTVLHRRAGSEHLFILRFQRTS
ncbi:S-adenosyl-L-methionine-dependent methyltransferase [Guyanagaster necrorhizus]|uniref:S-adenosyl-L-methionine-dependent methyltransferase n=1 Tax=Guyanagaster necrorhizus TaxID=856835 RepID=A0A9P7VZV9_9AGAR|nr:S-adenosyl-L-methionine-dependent methyltransferase [Guyanagaster necrorhizus MCA 3950]KAG7450193.1 S-adenosyl-L-methionine-dependent methyltransferase [Guyanagaster necrorhizus MCA 3950]